MATRQVSIYERVAGPNFFRSDPSFLSSFHHYAILLRDVGAHRASLLAARERFLKAVGTLQFGQNAKPSIKPGWVEEAAACLADLKAVFDQCGFSFFLISGTFLGAFRDGAILGHDKDIDIGIDEGIPLEELRGAFSRSAVFAIRPITSPRCLYLEHANGTAVDVFVHYMENGRYWHEGTKVRWWNSPFELSDAFFLKDVYKVPADADRYLTENYGAWRTPVVEFETFVDTPNMEVTNRDHMAWYFMTKLTDYFMMGRKPQFSRVWSALNIITQADDELRAAVDVVMDSAGVPPTGLVRKSSQLWQKSKKAMSRGPTHFAQRVGRYARRSLGL